MRDPKRIPGVLMAKKVKRHTQDDWDYEWVDDAHERDMRRARDEERRSRREQKTQYTHYDWNDDE